MQPDKIKHYRFCYTATEKAPKVLKPIWGAVVFIGVSVYKELIHDLLLGKGTPDWGDIRANWEGVKDSFLKKDMKY